MRVNELQVESQGVESHEPRSCEAEENRLQAASQQFGSCQRTSCETMTLQLYHIAK